MPARKNNPNKFKGKTTLRVISGGLKDIRAGGGDYYTLHNGDSIKLDKIVEFQENHNNFYFHVNGIYVVGYVDSENLKLFQNNNQFTIWLGIYKPVMNGPKYSIVFERV